MEDASSHFSCGIISFLQKSLIPKWRFCLIPNKTLKTQPQVSWKPDPKIEEKISYHELISFENDFKNTVYAMQILAPRITCICGCYATVKR